MNRTRRSPRFLRAALTAGAAGLLAITAMIGASSPAYAADRGAHDCGHLAGASHVDRFSGITHPAGTTTGCPAQKGGDPAIGTPPLLFHGGQVMGTRSTGPVVVTPIFWSPPGHPMADDYARILKTYLADVAADSGKRTNVYSTLNEYFGTNGVIRYAVRLGDPVKDKNALPADGCTVAATDTANIYADNTGYDSCLDDSQIIAETDRIVSARGLPRDYGHIYVMFLPKHVESCFYPGSTTTAANFCTINYQPSAAYCAYHSEAPSGAVYANMPFPIYNSKVGYTCGTEKDFGVVQTPNGNPDADVEVSPTSHEIMEAITDPDTTTGWFDSSGFENGDECAYVFGATNGPSGRLFNQVISGHRYLTQEEFSNVDFARTGGGCLQRT